MTVEASSASEEEEEGKDGDEREEIKVDGYGSISISGTAWPTALSGTDVAYVATRFNMLPRSGSPGICLRAYAMCGTDVVYGAMRPTLCVVLTWCMTLRGLCGVRY
eukprot:3189883-Rhodomonas_salina.1